MPSKTPSTPEAWETETGLIDNIDAWIANPRFGSPTREEYVEAAGTDVIHFLVDFEDADGEIVGSQGYSVGTGWVVSDDGKSISHASRANVVGSCIYGQLQNAVIKELEVDMSKYGSPLEADTWDRPGFHWKQVEHSTLKPGEMRSAPMPVSFLGVKEAAAKAAPAGKAASGGKAAAKAAAPAASEDLTAELSKMAKVMDKTDFQKAAMKKAGVADNDTLMSQVLDDSDEGFWATNQE